ncbi:MAG: hypothetical protein ABIB93_06115 [Chloroflexota bacterium]
MKQKLLVLMVILSLTLTAVRGTFTGFSDSEVSRDNYIEAGDLDLKIASASLTWEGSDFRDDPPYGPGIAPSFDIPDAQPSSTCEVRYLLWNAGATDGTVFLLIRIDSDEQDLTNTSRMSVWYDDNGDEVVESGELISESLGTLASQPVSLGLLPGYGIRRLKLDLQPMLVNEDGDPVWGHFSLDFRTEFQLVETTCSGFTDTEWGSGHIASIYEEGGIPGFWVSTEAVGRYGKDSIAGWFATIVSNSGWYKDITITGDVDTDYGTLVNDILGRTDDSGDDGMLRQFRAHYMAMQLNTMTGLPRLSTSITHDISSIRADDMEASVFFGYDRGALSSIIATIESKEMSGTPDGEPPAGQGIEMMKNICSEINNVRI